MKVLLLATAMLATPATASEAWTYLDRPDCLNPVIWISEELNAIERLDMFCSIQSKTVTRASITYVAHCETDAPSVEIMRIVVIPNSFETAVIAWPGLDTDTYRLCKEEFS